MRPSDSWPDSRPSPTNRPSSRPSPVMDNVFLRFILLLFVAQGMRSVCNASSKELFKPESASSCKRDSINHRIRVMRNLAHKCSKPSYLNCCGKFSSHLNKREIENHGKEGGKKVESEDIQDFVCEIIHLLTKSYKAMRALSKLNRTDITDDLTHCKQLNLSHTHTLFDEHLINEEEANSDVNKFKKSVSPDTLQPKLNSSNILHINESVSDMYVNKSQNDEEAPVDHIHLPDAFPDIPLSQKAQELLKTHMLEEPDETAVEQNELHEKNAFTFHPSENINGAGENGLPITLSSLDYNTILDQCKNASEVLVISPYRFVGKFSDYQKYLEKENTTSDQDTYFLLTPDNIFVPQKLFYELCKGSSDLISHISSELSPGDTADKKVPFQIPNSAPDNFINEDDKKSYQNMGLKKFFEIYVPYPNTNSPDIRTRKHALFVENNYKFEDNCIVPPINYPFNSVPYQTQLPNGLWVPNTLPMYNYM